MHIIASLVSVFTILTAVNGAPVSESCPNKLVTFNAGLVHTIPLVEQRKEELMRKLQNMKTDVVCLQEVYFTSDVIDIVKSVETVFPFTYSALHGRKGKLDSSGFHLPPCSWWNIWAFTCVTSYCDTTKSIPEVLSCAIKECDLWSGLSQECVSCTIISGFASVFDKCFGSLSTDMNIPGTVLLSKRPLRNRKVVPFVPDVKQLFPRSMLVADVENVGTVSCTHLTAYFGTTFFEPELQDKFSSFEEENAFETQFIIDYFKDDGNVIVMGDLNMGPQIDEKNITGEFKGSFDIFLANGYKSPYVTMVGKGTYNDENPYTNYGPIDILIDHVLYKGDYRSVAAKRVLDKTIDSIGGPLSDHYGVQVTLSEDHHVPE